jgi:hypothetical protein
MKSAARMLLLSLVVAIGLTSIEASSSPATAPVAQAATAPGYLTLLVGRGMQSMGCGRPATSSSPARPRRPAPSTAAIPMPRGPTGGGSLAAMAGTSSTPAPTRSAPTRRPSAPRPAGRSRASMITASPTPGGCTPTPRAGTTPRRRDHQLLFRVRAHLRVEAQHRPEHPGALQHPGRVAGRRQLQRGRPAVLHDLQAQLRQPGHHHGAAVAGRQPVGAGPVLSSGDRLPAAKRDGAAWDCRNPDWRYHWSNLAEYYCADDFFGAVRAAVAGWNGSVSGATPAQVAQAWGRGNPSSP